MIFVEADQDFAVVVGLSLPAGALGGIEELLGELGLLLVDGQELGGGLEVRARQAGVGVRAVLLRWPAAVPVRQGVGCSGQPVFDPFGVRGDRLRVEAEEVAFDVDSGLAVAFKLGADRGVVHVGIGGHLHRAGVAEQARDDVFGNARVDHPGSERVPEPVDGDACGATCFVV